MSVLFGVDFPKIINGSQAILHGILSIRLLIIARQDVWAKKNSLQKYSLILNRGGKATLCGISL